MLGGARGEWYDAGITTKEMQEIKIVKKEENRLVTRRNALIEARHRLSIQEQRLMLWVLSSIEPTDEGLKTYRVAISDLAAVAGITNKDIYTRLRKTTKKLMSRVIEIQEEERLLQRPLINQATYKTGEGYVDIRLDEDLKKYLIQLKENFTTIRLKYAFRLASTYALRIYEILVQYQRLGTRTITVKELRRMLDIEPKKHPRWDNFETFVLKVAEREINKQTDIFFTYKKRKKGKRIDSIEFKIKAQRTQEKDEAPSPALEGTEAAQLAAYGVSKRKAEKLAKSAPEAVQASIRALKTQKGEIANPAGWLVQFIEQGWTDSVRMNAERETKERREEGKRKALVAEHERKELAQARALSEKHRQQIERIVTGWSKTEENRYWKECKERIGNDLFSRGLIKKEGIKTWLSPMHRQAVREYLANAHGARFVTKEEHEAGLVAAA